MDGSASKLLLIVCVNVLALQVVVACNPQDPIPTTTPTPVTQTSAIEAVYSRVASIIGGRPLSPLFGDWPEDSAVVARLALALESAAPISLTEHLEANDRGRYLKVRWRDGPETIVRQVSRCGSWSDADAKGSGYGRCRGKWVRQSDTWWVEGMGIVESPNLGLWWEDMPRYMFPIGNMRAPKTIKAGEPFTIRLCCWDDFVQADAMNLSLVSADGFEIGLGEVPVLTDMQVPEVDYQWQGIVPEQTPGGRYWWRVSSDGFSELVDVVLLE